MHPGEVSALAARDNGPDAFSTPIDNPLVPRLPITFRNVAFATNVNVKIIRHVHGTPAIKQITARTLDGVIVHEVWTGPATLELRPNAQAPVYRLPVLDVVNGFYWWPTSRYRWARSGTTT